MSAASSIRRPLPRWAAFLTLVSLCILGALGTWQVQRHYWKQSVKADLAAARTDSSPPILSFADIQDMAAGPMMFAPALVQGVYDHAQDMKIQPRTYQGKAGYHIITPLKLADGGVVLVNRGWIPSDFRDPPRYDRPAGYVIVRGLLRRPEHYNVFVPDNNPAADQWFRIDPDAMAAAKKIETMAAVVLYADDETGSSEYPVRAALAWNPPDSHAYYAAFWFSMAGILVLIFYARFLRRSS